MRVQLYSSLVSGGFQVSREQAETLTPESTGGWRHSNALRCTALSGMFRDGSPRAVFDDIASKHGKVRSQGQRVNVPRHCAASSRSAEHFLYVRSRADSSRLEGIEGRQAASPLLVALAMRRPGTVESQQCQRKATAMSRRELR